MNSVSHFELPFDNQARAAKFYKGVFGWKVQHLPEVNYTMVQTAAVDKNGRNQEPGTINGGMMPREGTGKLPVIVITVASIARCIAKVEKAGGKLVMPKVPIGKMGFYARVKDSEGNIIGIWQTAKKR
jgi:predicted enzyme related to lactoylglutathione lyase